MTNYDAIVVGAGWSGAVVAERLAAHGHQVLVIEKRGHIGGNCWEETDPETSVVYHAYGPHIFHTDSSEVVEYLSHFTAWRPYEHRVLGNIDGQLVPLPFNLDTLHKLFPTTLAQRIEQTLLAKYPFEARVPILELLQQDDADLKTLADVVYRKVFLHYSAKQWGKKPEELSPAVTGRLPVVLSHDDRYFPDRWQLMPSQGFNPVFQKMLCQHGIHLLLNAPWQDVLQLTEDQRFLLQGQPFTGTVFFTAPLDELFAFRFGELPYRSLRFEYERHQQNQVQPVAVVNYPNLGDFTRVTEYKHLSGQKDLPHTLLMREFPQDYVRNHQIKGIPYYPIFTDDCRQAYQRYADLAAQCPNLVPLGRLAEYKYYDQDDAILKALQTSAAWLDQQKDL